MATSAYGHSPGPRVPRRSFAVRPAIMRTSNDAAQSRQSPDSGNGEQHIDLPDCTPQWWNQCDSKALAFC
jgi:hypothetical protein